MHLRTPAVFAFTLMLFLPCLTVGAQGNFRSGYIVTQNRDSLAGEIDFKDWGLNPVHISFRLGATARSSEFSVKDLVAFGVNGERYESHLVHLFPYSTRLESLESGDGTEKEYDTTVFLEVVASGRLTLWEYRTTGGVNYYFFNGSGDKPEELRMITKMQTKEGISVMEQEELFKNQLGFLLKDCPAAAGLAASARYNAASLEKLFFIYNNCGKDTTDKKKEGIRVQVFPLAGYFSSKVRFVGADVSAAQVYPAFSSLAGGMGALFILPRKRQQLSLVTDLLWQRFQSASNTVAVNSFTTASGHLDYSLLNVELLFRYRYPTNGLRPFVEAGMANSIGFGLSCYQTYVDDIHHSTTKQPLLDGGLRHYLLGWILGAGISAKRWTVEGRFEAGNGLSNVEGTASPTTSWYALFSYAL